MEHVRVPRAPHVAVPAPLPLPLELSKEERHRLRVVRHQAFQRHQQNAAWARELLEGQAPSPSTGSGNELRAFAARFAGGSREDVQQQLAEKNQALDAMKSDLARVEQQRERAERGTDSEVAALKQLNDPEAVAAARERLLAERAKLLGPADRKTEIVKL